MQWGYAGRPGSTPAPSICCCAAPGKASRRKLCWRSCWAIPRCRWRWGHCWGPAWRCCTICCKIFTPRQGEAPPRGAFLQFVQGAGRAAGPAARRAAAARLRRAGCDSVAAACGPHLPFLLTASRTAETPPRRGRALRPAGCRPKGCVPGSPGWCAAPGSVRSAAPAGQIRA